MPCPWSVHAAAVLSARIPHEPQDMLRRGPDGYGSVERNPSVHGLGSTSHQNPLGRVSIRRPSVEQLERASVVSIKS